MQFRLSIIQNPMSSSVEEVLRKRQNNKAAECVKSNCEGVNHYEIGFNTEMWFCKKHGWKENIARKRNDQ